MYTIYADGEILHNPLLSDEGRIVVRPVLNEKLNTHGSLRFTVAPTNPLYNELQARKTKIKVVTDTKNRKPWFGRVMSIENGWNNCLEVFCEGELGCLNDSIRRPFGFKNQAGTPGPKLLLESFVTTYNQSNTNGYQFSVGNVSVTDPNGVIVRSSKNPMTVWQAIDDNLFDSSLGGYIMPRYDEGTDTHYIDYLALDENDQYAVTSSQIIKFGQNLLDFSKFVSADDLITVLIPYGAEFDPEDPQYQEDPPENGTWNGNRLTVESVNGGPGMDYIDNADAIQIWGRIVGTKTWDDVTVAQNLLNKATAWLAAQVYQRMTIEVRAVDLAFVDVDIDQIQVGEYVRVQSMPHDLNILLLCTEKTTYLTELEESVIILGAGLKTLSDLEAKGGV